MGKLKLILAIILAGIGVALTYHVFENVVHAAIDLIWYDWFNTDTERLLVIPLAFILTLSFFALQHWLDPKSEKTPEHGLGEMPKPTIANFAKILLIGFFSLIAGASLGPEAILVPSCMVLGAIIGAKLLKQDQTTKLLAAAGLMALMAAFFNSFIVGVLSAALVAKQAQTKLTPPLILAAVIASLSSFFTLQFLAGEPFLQLPHHHWHINLSTLLLAIPFVAGGYLLNLGMNFAQNLFKKIRTNGWWQRALIAAAGISVLYLLGGPLIEFTGNRSITPMLDQAASLGLLGLIWVLIAKLAVISWSKAIGYRGGMVFPTIFLAATLVAIAQLYVPDVNLIYGIIAVLAGALIADRKTHALV